MVEQTGFSSTFGLPKVSLLRESVLTAQQSFIVFVLCSTKRVIYGETEGGKKREKNITPKTVCYLTNNGSPESLLVFVCSGWIGLALAQRLCFSPASFGQSVLCHGCLHHRRRFVVQQKLQRAVSVVAGRADLAAAVGVVVWN